MNELVTIIVPIYKVEPYIYRCVDSILRQTYKNLEIILVDDGSPDRCGEICDKYAKFDKRVKVIHKINGGLSDARNSGLEIAQGEYISFIDSDDWVNEKYVEELYKLLEKTNSDISVYNFIRTSSENIQVDTSKEEIYEYSNIEALEQLSDQSNKLYVQMVVAWGKLYKRNLFDDIRFPVGRIHEDEFTTYKLIHKSKKITLSTIQLLYYWQRADSIMGSGFNIRHNLDKIDAFEERVEFLRKVELEELSSKTCRTLFFMYFMIIKQINKFDKVIDKKEFNIKFINMRNSLRKSKQKFSFRVFYEMCFITPAIMDIFYRAYIRLRKIKQG